MPKVDDHKGKGKPNDHYEHGNEITSKLVDDVVEHYAEVTASMAAKPRTNADSCEL